MSERPEAGTDTLSLVERVDALSGALSNLIAAVEATDPSAKTSEVSEHLAGARELLGRREAGTGQPSPERTGPIAEVLVRGDRVWSALRSPDQAAESLLSLASLSEDDLRAALLSRLWLELSESMTKDRFAEWSSGLREFVSWYELEDELAPDEPTPEDPESNGRPGPQSS